MSEATKKDKSYHCVSVDRVVNVGFGSVVQLGNYITVLLVACIIPNNYLERHNLPPPPIDKLNGGSWLESKIFLTNDWLYF